MSETKTYVFPESGNNGGGGMMAMLAPSATEGHRPEFACSHERSQQQWFWRGGFMVHLGNLLVLPHGLGQQRMG